MTKGLAALIIDSLLIGFSNQPALNGRWLRNPILFELMTNEYSFIGQDFKDF